ncbi:N-acetyl sugar amidotransferase [Geobacter hydrogenophilus]|nr:N-acetyl sugar amidotransferase [Geobacter hydrogenophilus]
MQTCTRCLMDETVPNIVFDDNGYCNLCNEYLIRAQNEIWTHPDELGSLIDSVKKSRISKQDYDCVMGVSGGVDSCYALVVAVQNGLRPVAVHLDNGWNSNIAVRDIKNLLDRLKVPLVTEVLDWQGFRDLQVAFVKSGIPNWEIPTDHMITATLYRMAKRFSVKYILTGGNMTSEAIMPKSWMYDSRDATLIRSICAEHGALLRGRINIMSFLELAHAVFIKKIKYLPLLNYVHYDKEAAKQLLIDKFGWQDYGGKHYESIFTRFFQGYVLPLKYNIDKRKAYVSCAIMADQISREQAMKILDGPPMCESQIRIDRLYLLKKLRLSDKEFEDIMDAPNKSYFDYRNEGFIWGYRSGKSGVVMEKIRRFATKGV